MSDERKTQLQRELYKHVEAHMQAEFWKWTWEITMCRVASHQDKYVACVRVKVGDNWAVLTGLGFALNEVTQCISEQFATFHEKELDRMELENAAY